MSEAENLSADFERAEIVKYMRVLHESYVHVARLKQRPGYGRAANLFEQAADAIENCAHHKLEAVKATIFGSGHN